MKDFTEWLKEFCVSGSPSPVWFVATIREPHFSFFFVVGCKEAAFDLLGSGFREFDDVSLLLSEISDSGKCIGGRGYLLPFCSSTTCTKQDLFNV
jgi:hypothetical protein